MNKNKLNFWIDVGIGVAFAGVVSSGLVMWLSPDGANPVPLGLPYSEWKMLHRSFCMLMLIGAFVHIALHWKWIKAVIRSGAKSSRVRTNAWLDGLLFVTFVLALLSGTAEHDPEASLMGSVNALHLTSGLGMTSVVLVHLMLHWKWIVSSSRRYLDAASFQR